MTRSTLALCALLVVATTAHAASRSVAVLPNAYCRHLGKMSLTMTGIRDRGVREETIRAVLRERPDAKTNGGIYDAILLSVYTPPWLDAEQQRLEIEEACMEGSAK